MKWAQTRKQRLIFGERIIVPLDRRIVVYPGGAGVDEDAGVEEEVPLLHRIPTFTPAPPG